MDFNKGYKHKPTWMLFVKYMTERRVKYLLVQRVYVTRIGLQMLEQYHWSLSAFLIFIFVNNSACAYAHSYCSIDEVYMFMVLIFNLPSSLGRLVKLVQMTLWKITWWLENTDKLGKISLLDSSLKLTSGDV